MRSEVFRVVPHAVSCTARKDVSSLVDADQGCFGDGILARLALDLTTVQRAAERQTVDRQREQPKMIVMRPMAARWAWAAVAWSLNRAEL